MGVQVRTVKVRGRSGTRSLDLTIPAEVADSLGIRAGDLMELSAGPESGTPELKYRRIYKGPRK